MDEEVAAYKASLAKHNTLYKITEESREAGGSVIIKIKKQYNQSLVGTYLE